MNAYRVKRKVTNMNQPHNHCFNPYSLFMKDIFFGTVSKASPLNGKEFWVFRRHILQIEWTQRLSCTSLRADFAPRLYHKGPWEQNNDSQHVNPSKRCCGPKSLSESVRNGWEGEPCKGSLPSYFYFSRVSNELGGVWLNSFGGRMIVAAP